MQEVCLKKVIVGGSSSNFLISKVITWFQKKFPRREKKKFKIKIPSHSFAAGWSDEFQCVIVLESSWFGYTTIEWDRWRKKNKIIHAHYNTQNNMNESVKWSGKQLSASYDYKSLFIYVLKYLYFLITMKWIRHPKNTPKAMYCSEAKTRFVQQEGYWSNVHAESVYPVNLWIMLNDTEDFLDVTEQVKSDLWWSEFKK